jgi:hypothetical protein
MSANINIPFVAPHELDIVGGGTDIVCTPYCKLREVRRYRYLARLKRCGVDITAAPPLTAKAPLSNLDTQVRARQCIAVTNVTLARCTNAAMRGQMICAAHGGAHPMAKLEGRKRLLAMCEPAFGVLEELMREPGVEDEVKLKASIAVLDRAGFAPKNTLAVQHKMRIPEGMTETQVLERGRRILAVLEARKQRAEDDAIEAEIVGDER